jgi:hypothetical protein
MIVILNNYFLKQGPCGICKSPWQPKIRANIIYLFIYFIIIIIIILKGEVSSFLPHKITSLSIVRFLWFFLVQFRLHYEQKLFGHGSWVYHGPIQKVGYHEAP